MRAGVMCSARYMLPRESHTEPAGSTNGSAAETLSANELKLPVDAEIWNTFASPMSDT